MCVTDISNICMEMFHDEKKITIFNLASSGPMHILNKTDSAYFVKSTPPRVFGVSSFFDFAGMLQTY